MPTDSAHERFCYSWITQADWKSRSHIICGGMPAPMYSQSTNLKQLAIRIKDWSAEALQYGSTEGYRPLGNWLRGILNDMESVSQPGISWSQRHQQALDLIGKVFINPGDRILVEEPTYMGALQAWNAYGAEYVTVPMDDNGWSRMPWRVRWGAALSLFTCYRIFRIRPGSHFLSSGGRNW